MIRNFYFNGENKSHLQKDTWETSYGGQ